MSITGASIRRAGLVVGAFALLAPAGAARSHTPSTGRDRPTQALVFEDDECGKNHDRWDVVSVPGAARFTTRLFGAGEPAVDAAGTHIAFQAIRTGGIVVLDLRSGRVRTVVGASSDQDARADLTWSGKSLLIDRGRRGHFVVTPQGRFTLPRQHWWLLPGGRAAVTITEQDQVLVATARRRWRPVTVATVPGINSLPGGALTADNGSTVLFFAVTPARVLRLPSLKLDTVPLPRLSGVSLAPDGRTVAASVSGDTDDVRLVDVATGTARTALSLPRGTVSGFWFSWSPSGALAVGGYDPQGVGAVGITLLDPGGRHVRWRAPGIAVGWSPHGRRLLAFGADGLSFVDPRTGREQTIRGPAGPFYGSLLYGDVLTTWVDDGTLIIDPGDYAPLYVADAADAVARVLVGLTTQPGPILQGVLHASPAGLRALRRRAKGRTADSGC
jgi:hypothetical protein